MYVGRIFGIVACAQAHGKAEIPAVGKRNGCIVFFDFVVEGPDRSKEVMLVG